MNEEFKEPIAIWRVSTHTPRIFATRMTVSISNHDEIVIQLGQFFPGALANQPDVEEVGRVLMTRKMLKDFILTATRAYNKSLKDFKAKV